MRVLILSTYPASALDSGGVIRLRALNAALNAGGHQTHVLAIMTPGSQATASASPSETVLHLKRQHFSPDDWAALGYHDILTGLRCLDDRELVARAESLVGKFRPDVVMIEQPFLIGLAERLRSSQGQPLIYSAANLETDLKRDLVALVPQFYRHPDDLLAEVAAAERLAAARAVLTLAIAPGMVQALTDWGAKRVVVFGNGARNAAAPASAPGAHPLQAMMAQSEFTCFGCFGSAYWPNREGIASVLWPSLAFLPPNARMIMTGRLHQEVRTHASYERGRAINDVRLLGFGHLSGGDFDHLVNGCDALLLPVFVGSGSALKSADALASGRPVLMSRAMAVGYEDIIATCPDGLQIVDDPTSFRSAWQDWAKLGKAGLAELAGNGRERARSLNWASRLNGLAQAVASVSVPGETREHAVASGLDRGKAVGSSQI